MKLNTTAEAQVGRMETSTFKGVVERDHYRKGEGEGLEVKEIALESSMLVGWRLRSHEITASIYVALRTPPKVAAKHISRC